MKITKDVTNPVFQIDLQHPMQYKIIDSDEKLCSSKRDGDFIFIETKKNYKKGETHSFTIQYSGNPTVAKNAPWDGAWVYLWLKESLKNITEVTLKLLKAK